MFAVYTVIRPDTHMITVKIIALFTPFYDLRIGFIHKTQKCFVLQLSNEQSLKYNP